MTPAKLYPRTALILLTALNLFNYVDRSVLFAVQPLVQAEFHRSDASFGLLTSVFFIFYMFAAPFMGPLAKRFARKPVSQRPDHNGGTASKPRLAVYHRARSPRHTRDPFPDP